MKRSLYKQLIVSALFVCTLSADVPDGREKVAERVHSTGGGSFVFYDSHALSRPIWLSVPLAGTTPDPLERALSVVSPLGSLGIDPMARVCVRWGVLPSMSPEEMNVPMDPLAVAFFCPRYQRPLALQASVWSRPVGFGSRASAASVAEAMAEMLPRQIGESASAFDGAGRAGGADMAAMIPRLKKVFMKAGVPQQWVWVAQVESALNPRAKSSAGAVGLFQLMPGTARRFGLQTEPVDDRMEPEKSAGAAAQYLKLLHQEFGCWSLALAAYNAGEGRVKDIMKKRKASTFDEVERYLPPETRAYVPKVMAAVALREDQLHGVPGAYWMP